MKEASRSQIGLEETTPEPKYLYRGVHANHPRIAEARRGIVVPGNLEGTVSPSEHNDGGAGRDSPYTSWSRSIKIARDLAGNAPGGVVLRIPLGAPDPSDQWHFVWSPDRYGEQEVLLFGIRMDAEVVE